MAALIIRIPDGKRDRLKDLARARKQSVTKLLDEIATVLIAERDAALERDRCGRRRPALRRKGNEGAHERHGVALHREGREAVLDREGVGVI